MRIRAGRLCVAASVLPLVVACSSGSSPVAVAPSEPVPTVHGSASWIDASKVALWSMGATAVGPGWAEVDLRLAGIVVLDVTTGAHDLVVPGAVIPRAHPATSGIVGLSAWWNGSIVYWRPGDTVTLEDSATWGLRAGVCMNDAGTLIAWRSFSGEHDVGIWILSLGDRRYRYLGQGSDPIWRKGANRLLYERWGEGVVSGLVEYDCDSGQVVEVWEFPADLGGRGFALSPDGASLSFAGIGFAAADCGLYILDLESLEARQINERCGTATSWGERGIIYDCDCKVGDDSHCGVIWIYDPIAGTDQPLTDRFQFVEPTLDAGEHKSVPRTPSLVSQCAPSPLRGGT